MFISMAMALGMMWGLNGCMNAPEPQASEKETVEEQNRDPYLDEAYTRFFARDCCGMTGADGTYSVALPDGRTAWIFGDTFLGTVNEDLSRDKRDPLFVRNTIAVQDGDNLTTYYGKHEGRETSLVVPDGAPIGGPFSEGKEWFWPGDGFIEGGKLKLFLSKFYQAEAGNWGFRWLGTHMATFSLPDMRLENVQEFKLAEGPEVHWGHAVYDGDKDYTYIYGLGSGKPYVARAPKGNVTGSWEFFNGESWSGDPAAVQPMVDFEGGEQFSVFREGDKYVYLSHSGGFSKDVYTFTSDLPFTGWTNKKKALTAEPPVKDTNLFVYNAVAHPELSKDGWLLVSYNVNSFELEAVFEDARKYRPIFYRVSLDGILAE